MRKFPYVCLILDIVISKWFNLYSCADAVEPFRRYIKIHEADECITVASNARFAREKFFQPAIFNIFHHDELSFLHQLFVNREQQY